MTLKPIHTAATELNFVQNLRAAIALCAIVALCIALRATPTENQTV